ncbi:MAG: type II secretion system F family protein [Pirellulales bacterium]|nr:type II secretion system F family protein [Pirellulales bacterium]
MSNFWIGITILAGLLVVIALSLRQLRRRRLAARLLAESSTQKEIVAELDEFDQLQFELADRPFVNRQHWLSVVIGIVVFVSCFFLVGLKWPYALATGIWGWVISLQIDQFRVSRAHAKIESQLSRSIDFLVSAIRAGAALPLAMDQAVEEMKSPLYEQFSEVNTRIRLGDQPSVAMTKLVRRVPLETFNLFATAIAVHWEVGGALAEPLSSVGRTIRDRIQISRRIFGASVQAKLSTLSIMIVTYLIMIMMYVSDPEIVGGFLATTIGQFLVSIGMILQAIGLLIIGHLSKLRV